MDHNQFWTIIEYAKRISGGDCETYHDTLRDMPLLLPQEEIVAFDRIFDELLIQSLRYDLRGVARIITGSGSDDGFTDFRSWLIGQGKTVYLNALANRDSLASVVLENREDAECEQLAYAAQHAYQDKTGEEMPDYARNPIAMKGHPLHYDELRTTFPNVARKYNFDSDEND